MLVAVRNPDVGVLVAIRRNIMRPTSATAASVETGWPVYPCTLCYSGFYVPKMLRFRNKHNIKYKKSEMPYLSHRIIMRHFFKNVTYIDHAHTCVMCGEIPPSWSGSIIQCNKELGILLLGTQEDQFQKICAMLHDEGLDVQRSPLPDIETWDELLDKCPVDIVVAGDHPAGSKECVKFARYLIRRNPLIDVLLYDVDRIDETTKYDKSLYTKIWTHDGAEFAQRALSMINMGRSKWNDIIFLRGMVISQVVELESYINEALAAYFGSDMSDKLGKQFTEFILENPTFLLEGKKKVLQRILVSAGRGGQWRSIGSKLSNLQSLRNKVAHCGVEPDEPNLIISMDKEYKYDRVKMRKIIQDARQARLHLIDLAKDMRNTQNSM